ncbi:anthranilate synthase component I family protein [Candidatus Bipolaricaulota bacterium]|nr:anthranilate synthase component I family protein [Candidatus Bipolaricaulota bacterium]
MIGFGSPEARKATSSYRLLDDYLTSSELNQSPTLKQLRWELTEPYAIYSRLHSQFETSFILESSAGPDELAEYTFLGFDPKVILTLSSGLFKENGETVLKTSNPLHHLKELERRLKNFAPEDFNRYLGGLVGYTSYDFVRYLEDLSATPGEKKFPDLQMGLFTDGIVHSRDKGTLTYFSYGKDRSSELKELTRAPGQEGGSSFRISDLESDFCRSDFTSSVNEARDYIYSGDIYQVVLSRELTGKLAGDPLEAYKELREINPSPYMYHLKFGDRRVIGSSPEELVSVTDDKISTYPIAGTRPLGNTPQEREKLRTELITDDKERAEHNMLVDLARNDVGRVAKYGSVDVPEYMKVKKFSHVQHIVSKVTGKLPEDRTLLEAFAALFPAGTVSGAPKVRAMELIDELEINPRGPYAGAVGYISFTGDLDSCITIRSLFTKENQISLRAGAGIVADSDPKKEWEEINHKLGALRDAVSPGGGGSENN